MGKERNHLDEIVGVIERPNRRAHYVAHRRVLNQLGEWEVVDSIGPKVRPSVETKALRPSNGKYLFLHTTHRDCAHIDIGVQETTSDAGSGNRRKLQRVAAGKVVRKHEAGESTGDTESCTLRKIKRPAACKHMPKPAAFVHKKPAAC